jgi:hypothetical protein
MIGDKILIIDLDDSVGDKVKLGSDNILKVIGKRMVNIRTKQGKKRHIPNVYYAQV